jgi:hypothetical protein
LSLLSIGSASAAGEAEVDLAQRAATVHERDCSQVSVGGATQAAQAMVRVVPLLAEVSESYDRSKEPFLLYWRGMLQDCLGQEDRAITDLQSFLRIAGDDPLQAAPLEEARRRLRRLGEPVESSRSAPAANPGVVLGAVLIGAGGAFGGLGAWQGVSAQNAQDEFDAGGRPWAQSQSILEAGQTNANASAALIAGAAGSGIAGIVAMIVGGTTSGTPSVAVLPTEHGVVAAVGLQW